MLLTQATILGLALGAFASRHPIAGAKQQKYGKPVEVVRRSAGRSAVVKRAEPISPKIFVVSLVSIPNDGLATSRSNLW